MTLLPHRPLLQTALDLLFPRTCPACRKPVTSRGEREELVCHRCSGQLMPIPSNRCRTCGEPFYGHLDESFQCSNCRERTFAFEFAISGYRNSGIARDMVHRLKYQGHRWLRDPLGRMVAAAIREDPRIDLCGNAVLVPVPAHRVRQRERGFNQAREIAVVAGRILAIPVVECLVRLLPTPRQCRPRTCVSSPSASALRRSARPDRRRLTVGR